jgi:prolyl 4-hydroxylase
MSKFLRLLAATALFASVVAGDNPAQAPLASSDDDAYTCADPPYKVRIYSRSPLVIYITDFITPFERKHLLKLA